jgi:hypothetical protein
MISLLKSSVDEFVRETSQSVHSVSTPKCVFDIVFKNIREHHDLPVHSISELRKKTTKCTGDLFEEFCKLYLINFCKYDNVWLLREVPESEKRHLKMPFGDMDYGIDIICKRGNVYSAVQCKFKTPRPPIRVSNKRGESKIIFPCVGWKELSTFNELCNTTGPWSQRIVMTTAKSVRRLGGIKIQGDKSICIGTFNSLRPEDITKMIGQTSQKHDENKETTEKKVESEPITIEELRNRRLKYFCR